MLSMGCWVLTFFGLISVLAYRQVSIAIWTVFLAVFLTALTLLSNIGFVAMGVLWALLLSFAVIFNILPVRRRVFSGPILKLYRKHQPNISDTEREALMAGGIGWEKELFGGLPDWNGLNALPEGQLSDEEQAFLDGPVEQLCGMIDNWSMSEAGEIPKKLWSFVKDQGFLSMIIPKEYGGKAFSHLAHFRVISKIASVNGALATIVGVPNSLGPGELLVRYGTQGQKDYYLPRLATGEEIPCFALTSPVAGSDAASMTDSGVVCRAKLNGKEQLCIRLNWDKRYITLSPLATLLGLAFKLYDPDHLLGEKENLGITCALIPTKTKGVEVGRQHVPLRSVFPNGPTKGKDVLVAIDAIIGGADMAGQGWRMLMECLATGRGISLPAMTLGVGKRAASSSLAYAQIRQQFNLPIAQFEGIEEVLVRMAARAVLMEAMSVFTVTALDRGENPTLASAMSKYHMTEMGRKMLNDAMDVHGGKGICMGPNNYLAQAYTEVPIAITVEGANILTRSLIIFGQGAIRCHPYILKEMDIASREDSADALAEFDQVFCEHFSFIVRNEVRSFVLALTGGRLVKAPAGKLKRYYQHLSRFSTVFAYLVDISFIFLGASLKRREKLSGRLADMISLLYQGASVLQYAHRQENEKLLPMIEWLCQDILYQLQVSIDQFLANLPFKWLVGYLRLVIFPLGKRFNPVSDRLGHQVMKLLLTEPDVAAVLYEHAYMTPTEHNPAGKMQAKLKTIIEAQPVEKVFTKAVREGKVSGCDWEAQIKSAVEEGVLTKDQADQLREVNQLRRAVTDVDDF